jgi:hypothetical protein
LERGSQAPALATASVLMLAIAGAVLRLSTRVRRIPTAMKESTA